MSRTIRLLAACILAALLVSACQPIHAPVSEAAPTATPVPTVVPSPTATFAPIPNAQMELRAEKITSQALAGNLLGDPAERTVYVLLPPSYATTDKRYPEVYVMPWGDGEPSANTWGFKAAMESLLRNGEIPEMIVVVPDGTNKLGPAISGVL